MQVWFCYIEEQVQQAASSGLYETKSLPVPVIFIKRRSVDEVG
ncbi:hypothetical protein MKY92_04785 [Paenibacillus sp. FSL R5-0623]